MTRSIHGKLRGRTIELAEDMGLADGEDVEVVVTLASPRPASGEGIRRSAGVAVDNPDFDDVFEQIAKERKVATFRDASS